MRLKHFPEQRAYGNIEYDHELKITPQMFDVVLDGTKTFEFRSEADRHFEEGQLLFLREWTEKDGYSGRKAPVERAGLRSADGIRLHVYRRRRRMHPCLRRTPGDDKASIPVVLERTALWMSEPESRQVSPQSEPVPMEDYIQRHPVRVQ